MILCFRRLNLGKNTEILPGIIRRPGAILAQDYVRKVKVLEYPKLGRSQYAGI